jgi:hypothetical protein
MPSAGIRALRPPRMGRRPQARRLPKRPAAAAAEEAARRGLTRRLARQWPQRPHRPAGLAAVPGPSPRTTRTWALPNHLRAGPAQANHGAAAPERAEEMREPPGPPNRLRAGPARAHRGAIGPDRAGRSREPPEPPDFLRAELARADRGAIGPDCTREPPGPSGPLQVGSARANRRVDGPSRAARAPVGSRPDAALPMSRRGEPPGGCAAAPAPPTLRESVLWVRWRLPPGPVDAVAGLWSTTRCRRGLVLGVGGRHRRGAKRPPQPAWCGKARAGPPRARLCA